MGYWESLLSQLKAHLARARLRDKHSENLRRKLELLKAEQGVESDHDGVDEEEDDDDTIESSEQVETQAEFNAPDEITSIDNTLEEYVSGSYRLVVLDLCFIS